MSGSTLLDRLTDPPADATPKPPPSEATATAIGEILLAALSLAAELTDQGWAVIAAQEAIDNLGEKALTAEEAAIKLIGFANAFGTAEQRRKYLDAQAIAAANIVADAAEEAKLAGK